MMSEVKVQLDESRQKLTFLTIALAKIKTGVCMHICMHVDICGWFSARNGLID